MVDATASNTKKRLANKKKAVKAVKATDKKPAAKRVTKGGEADVPRISYKPIKRRCDIGYIVKDHVKPLMQAMTNDIKSYNMRLITTKCLNTAVLFMVLFFGKDALIDTEQCDVKNVVERHKSARDDNLTIVRQLAAELMSNANAAVQKRQVFYIMLTDGEFVKPDGKTAFFPGHVMVWEKVPSPSGCHYYIYQSYINKYDYRGSLAFREWSAVSQAKMSKFMLRLERFMTERVWNQRMVNFWTDLTNVDTSNMLGGVPQDCFYLCYRVRENRQCLTNFYRLINTTLRAIPKDVGTQDQIYGSNSDYERRERPLTNREMTVEFETMKTRVEQAIKDDHMPCRLVGTCSTPA